MMIHVERIETLRIKHGLTKQKLAELAGMTGGNLTAILKKGQTSMLTCQCLAQALSVPVQRLIRVPRHVYAVDLVKVEQFRKDQEWTISQIGHQIGCTYESYAQMVRTGWLGSKHVKRLSEVMEIDLQDLLVFDTQARQMSENIAEAVVEDIRPSIPLLHIRGDYYRERIARIVLDHLVIEA